MVYSKNSQIKSDSSGSPSFSRFMFCFPRFWPHKIKSRFCSAHHWVLMMFALQYGDVLNILISSKKKGSAVVEFASAKAAVSILHLQRHNKTLFFYSIMHHFQNISAAYWEESHQNILEGHITAQNQRGIIPIILFKENYYFLGKFSPTFHYCNESFTFLFNIS